MFSGTLFNHLHCFVGTTEFFTRQQPADNNKLNISLNIFERAKSAGIKAETACGDAWLGCPKNNLLI